MTLTEKAKILRQYIEKAAQSLADDDALQSVELFAAWSGDGVQYAKDDRVRYEGKLYKVLLEHVSQPAWTPTDSPSLFAKVLIPVAGEIPEWEQPDSTNAYKKGDRVRYNGKVFESLIDNNVWSPDGYPAGWQLIEE